MLYILILFKQTIIINFSLPLAWPWHFASQLFAATEWCTGAERDRLERIYCLFPHSRNTKSTRTNMLCRCGWWLPMYDDGYLFYRSWWMVDVVISTRWMCLQQKKNICWMVSLVDAFLAHGSLRVRRLRMNYLLLCFDGGGYPVATWWLSVWIGALGGQQI